MGVDQRAARPDYSSFNFEQQAQIFADWSVGNDPAHPVGPTAGNQSKTLKYRNSPYFRYVLEARLGRFGWENW